MGVTRIDDLPENRIVRKLQDGRQVSRERKGSNQRTGGANLAYLISQSASTYDWSGLVDGATGSPDYGIAQFIITLTAANVDAPLVDLAMLVYYNNGSGFIEYSRERSFADAFPFTPPEMIFNVLPLPGIANGVHESKWRVWLNANMNTNAAFKLQAVGIDDVTISVSRIL